MNSLVRAVLQKVLRTQSLSRTVDFVTRTTVESLHTISHEGVTLRLAHPNPQIRSRNTTFHTKEPDTLRWIEGFKPNSIVWDIGANIGLYSVYSGLRGHTVMAIEPSVFNLEFLVRNISTNNLSNQVSILPIAIGNLDHRIATLHLKSTAWGDSQNAFATPRGQSGDIEAFQINYQTLGLGLDTLISQLNFPTPDYIKIDVDGIEPDILESGVTVLRSVTSVLVELPMYKEAEQRIKRILEASGLSLVSSRHRNQIWNRR